MQRVYFQAKFWHSQSGLFNHSDHCAWQEVVFLTKSFYCIVQTFGLYNVCHCPPPPLFAIVPPGKPFAHSVTHCCVAGLDLQTHACSQGKQFLTLQQYRKLWTLTTTCCWQSFWALHHVFSTCFAGYVFASAWYLVCFQFCPISKTHKTARHGFNSLCLWNSNRPEKTGYQAQ